MEDLSTQDVKRKLGNVVQNWAKIRKFACEATRESEYDDYIYGFGIYYLNKPDSHC